MKRFTWYLPFLVLAGLICWPIQARAQQEGDPPARDTDFTFTLGKVIGQPGTEVSMWVLFGRKPGAANVSKLRARVRYPGAVLKYNRIEDAYLSRRVSLQVQGKESKGSGAESVLEMEFELPDAQGTQFPSGQIATVFFNIASEAADQTVPLQPEAWIDGVQVMPDSPVALIQPGHVRVSQNPVLVGCFFFTH